VEIQRQGAKTPRRGDKTGRKRHAQPKTNPLCAFAPLRLGVNGLQRRQFVPDGRPAIQVQYFNPNTGQNLVETKFCPVLEKALKHINSLFINVLQQ
jgi:hypothetical protein